MGKFNLYILIGVVSMAILTSTLPSYAAVSKVDAKLANGHAILSNSNCRLELDAKTGEIVSLKPGPVSLKGKWFEIVEEDRNGMQPWETWKRGEESVFSSGPASTVCSVKDGTAQAVITWKRPTGLTVEGQVRIGKDDKGPLFRLKVTNNTGAVLTDTIKLPVLRGIELEDKNDDWFTWPHTLGSRFRAHGFGPGTIMENPYPAFMYMQWLDIYDKSQGVYIGCNDDYGYSKSLFIGKDTDSRSVMGINFTGCWIAKKGDSWTTPWVQIAAHKGDWRAGADIYRPFAEKAFGPLYAPERVREMPTAQCWLAHHASDGDVGKLFEVQQQAPIHASYLMKSLNTSHPEGWDGFRGSGLDYQKSFDKIKELGGSSALFTFDRAPLMGFPNYANYVGKWTCKRRDGSIEEGFRDMMPSPFDADFRKARVDEAVRWVRNFGLDEIHYDTEGTCGFTGTVGTGMLAGPSYDPNIPQRPNEVPHYFKELYRATVAECRKYNPEFILRAEHCADFFFPEFITSTAHFFETGNVVKVFNPPHDAQLMPQLFRYTLPRHAAMEMPSMSSDDFWTFGYGMGYGFHGGGPSWSFNPGVREAETPPGELLHRYRFYESDWRRYYDFRVGFEEAVIDTEHSDIVAEAQIDGKWSRCEFPGPVVAVTHTGAGREVTLGQWFHQSISENFGAKFVGAERIAPRPVRLRIPTKIKDPQVRFYGKTGELPSKPQIANGMIEIDVEDPTTFAVEVFNGPAMTLKIDDLAYPGQITNINMTVKQDKPLAGTITLQLPAGWPKIKPVTVPAKTEFTYSAKVKVPAGLFGRNYPIKAVLRTGSLKRTTAVHMKIMEPLTVLYSFDTVGKDGMSGINCVEQGQKARFTVTCVNNTPSPASIDIKVVGEQVSGTASQQIAGMPTSDLGREDSPLNMWIESKGPQPGNAVLKAFEFDCTGISKKPVNIRISMNGKQTFNIDAHPRTRLMDLNGDWKMKFTPLSRATVGGAERLSALDTESVTPDVWDGNWRTVSTPIQLSADERKDNIWALYRKLVYIPSDWQGTDIGLRLNVVGDAWGEGTLSIIYINGWPAGRIGQSGECSVSPFIIFGGWNLIAVSSFVPDRLVNPYLFARTAPDPSRVKPVETSKQPSGAFVIMGQRITGQGISLPFIQGVPEADYRRTNLAMGGEHSFIYFAVADAFMREPGYPVEIEVEYLDKGTARFGVDYDSTDVSAPVNGAFKSGQYINKTDTGTWKTHVFILFDAKFTNREHQGSDFRIAAEKEDLCIRRVEVRKVVK
ncbi:MAG: hypothetical protein ACYC27_15685 [Armatimonadota bacterium]